MSGGLRAKWFGGCIGRALGDDRGASAVEYALVLALVPIVAIAGFDWCSTSFERPFSEIATSLNDTSGDAAQHAASTTSTVGAGQAASEASSWRHSIDAWRLPLMLLSAGTVVAGLVLTRRRQSRERLLSSSSEDVPPCPLASERVAAKRQQILRQLARDIRLVVNNQVEVRQIMTSDPMVVPPTALVDVLTPQMIERRTRHMLVCDEDGQLLGVISDRDVLARSGRRAADIMTRYVASVSTNSPLGPAITLMLNRQISCLPVVDEGKLRGIITTSDVLMTLQCTLHLLARGDDQFEAHSGTTISQLCEGHPAGATAV